MNLVHGLVFLFNLVFVRALFIDGCPLWGCRPSGSFSFYLKVPHQNATVNWVSDLTLDPVPNALGCVADSVNIVCQSNGPFKEDTGFICLSVDNGTLQWRDKVLHFPTLPLLDNYGDVTGSDGRFLVHYDFDGKLYPKIKCYGLVPMFSMQLVGTMYLLLVGEQGGLVVRDTNAIPVAEIFLNDTIQNANGTFLPISQPVVNGQRFYLLTEFVPEDDSDSYAPSVLNLQRLFAIDINDRPADIMTIAWFFNFEMEDKHTTLSDKLIFQSRQMQNEKHDMKISRDGYSGFNRRARMNLITDSINSMQNVLWNNASGTIFVSLPPPYLSSRNDLRSFWIFEDKNDTVQLVSRSDNLYVTHMSTWEPDSDWIQYDARKTMTSYIWATTMDSMLIQINADGSLSKSIDLRNLLGDTTRVTTKIALTKDTDESSEVIVFGVMVGLQSYAVAIDASLGTVLWKLPVPNNMVLKGQVSGVSGAASRIRDQLILYAELPGKSAQIISIH
ncbi:uncharacterized protein LOC127840998 [Dreissena polymorpha]|uniref:Uncharacterized protein n=1 Tax=Dreissena polymorpha TaxID=45954 RepID=A0A9D4EQ83_DREPO|nr:uncharacterized protein LOC127840998 [Dreissena polymorpha]KAH3782531.1 hypothetical protein DPMN_160448 [Dreissena polymorpha]